MLTIVVLFEIKIIDFVVTIRQAAIQAVTS